MCRVWIWHWQLILTVDIPPTVRQLGLEFFCFVLLNHEWVFFSGCFNTCYIPLSLLLSPFTCSLFIHFLLVFLSVRHPPLLTPLEHIHTIITYSMNHKIATSCLRAERSAVPDKFNIWSFYSSQFIISYVANKLSGLGHNRNQKGVWCDNKTDTYLKRTHAKRNYKTTQDLQLQVIYQNMESTRYRCSCTLGHTHPLYSTPTPAVASVVLFFCFSYSFFPFSCTHTHAATYMFLQCGCRHTHTQSFKLSFWLTGLSELDDDWRIDWIKTVENVIGTLKWTLSIL